MIYFFGVSNAKELKNETQGDEAEPDSYEPRLFNVHNGGWSRVFPFRTGKIRILHNSTRFSYQESATVYAQRGQLPILSRYYFEIR